MNKKWHNFIGQIIWLYNLQRPSFVKHDHCATIVSKPMTTKRQINQNYWRSRCKRYENVVGRKYCLQKKWQRQLTTSISVLHCEVFKVLEFFSFILQDYSVNLDLLKEKINTGTLPRTHFISKINSQLLKWLFLA